MAIERLGFYSAEEVVEFLAPGGNADLSGEFQVTDPTLTNFALLAWTAGTQVPVLTGADTFALRSVGAASASDLIDRAAGDLRYAAVGTIYTDEMARDALGVALTAGAGITVTVNDGADTITIATTITQYTDELAQDAVGAILADTATIDLTYSDATPSITADVKANSIGTSKLGDDITAAGESMLTAADAAAQRVLLRSGAMVKKSADQTGADYTTFTSIAWDAEVYDDGGHHDNVTNNTRLTILVDGRYRVGANVRVTNGTAGVNMTLNIIKGTPPSAATASFDGAASDQKTTAATAVGASVSTGPVVCVAGEYFETQMIYATDTSIDIIAARSNFWIEAC